MYRCVVSPRSVSTSCSSWHGYRPRDLRYTGTTHPFTQLTLPPLCSHLSFLPLVCLSTIGCERRDVRIVFSVVLFRRYFVVQSLVRCRLAVPDVGHTGCRRRRRLVLCVS